MSNRSDASPLRTSALVKESAEGKGSNISRFSSCSARERKKCMRRFVPGLDRVTHAPGDSSRTRDSTGSGRNSSSCVGNTGTSRFPPGGRTGTPPGSPGPQRPTLKNKGRKGDTYRIAITVEGNVSNILPAESIGAKQTGE